MDYWSRLHTAAGAGDTPLMQAAVNGHIECVYLLLNAHADVNLCTQVQLFPRARRLVV